MSLPPVENTVDDVLEESELLLELIRSIVTNPAAVSVDAARGQKNTLLTITVDPKDRGHVLGKDHKTFDALQHLFSKAAYMCGRQLTIALDGHNRVQHFQGTKPHEAPHSVAYRKSR
jgi:predicted RNA-binding protein YlqC (UPF0109 family)